LAYLHVDNHSLSINFLKRPGSLKPPSQDNYIKFQAFGPVLRGQGRGRGASTGGKNDGGKGEKGEKEKNKGNDQDLS